MKNNLSVLMGRERISANELHKRTGISKTTIHFLYYEKTENPEIKTVKKLCDYFNCTFDEFFKLEEANQNEQNA